MSDQAIALLAVAVMAAGIAFIFWAQDRDNPTSLALAMTMLAVTLLLLTGTLLPQAGSTSALRQLWIILLETVGLLYGLEWARRIAASSAQRMGGLLNGLLRAAQIMILVYGGLALGYLLIAPEAATSDGDGLIVTRGYEFAIFAPIIGTAVLLATIAGLLLLAARIDPAEAIRVKAMFCAAPFFLLALIFAQRYVPLLIAIGLTIFMLGAVAYLMVTSRRAQFMGQFLAPELQRLARDDPRIAGSKPEVRELSVVACDLRGFTAYAGAHASADVTTLLEDYFEQVGMAAAAHGGTVKDHAGDGVLILVGAPATVEAREQAALAIALHIREQVGLLLSARAPEVGVGVGLASGTATVGAVRGAGRLEYMAVGQVVNRAARLCDAAADGEVLLDGATAEALGDEPRLAPRAARQLKGLPDQTVYCAG